MTQPPNIDLPPVPDRVTGEPRPPAVLRRETKAVESTPANRKPRKHPPSPVDELGPILEWSQNTPRTAWLGGALVFLIAAVFLTANNGFAWMSLWWMWLFILLFGWGIVRILGKDWVAAGAVWVQSRDAWVNTYELTRITFSVDGYNRVLRVEDGAGRKIHSLKLRSLQVNPPLWDLVYNGILHSVASGNCDISDKARKEIRLPENLGRPN